MSGLESGREVGAIVPQAMMVAAVSEAFVGMRSCTSELGAVGRCEGSGSSLTFEERSTPAMANLTAPGGLHPHFSGPSPSYASMGLPNLNLFYLPHPV